jgi:hypothetical protein
MMVKMRRSPARPAAPPALRIANEKKPPEGGLEV